MPSSRTPQLWQNSTTTLHRHLGKHSKSPIPPLDLCSHHKNAVEKTQTAHTGMRFQSASHMSRFKTIDFRLHLYETEQSQRKRGLPIGIGSCALTCNSASTHLKKSCVAPRFSCVSEASIALSDHRIAVGLLRSFGSKGTYFLRVASPCSSLIALLKNHSNLTRLMPEENGNTRYSKIMRAPNYHKNK